VPPHLSQESFPALVEELRPTFVAWVASFLITGMYWVGHRDVFARVRFVNRDLVWLNLLFLLPASLIPFAASVLGQYPDESFALRIYGVVMIAASLMSLALYGYVIRHPGLCCGRARSAAGRGSDTC
ncbi:MAG TPA: TMEM175 family protein, partial [Actinomycetes bacterium]